MTKISLESNNDRLPYLDENISFRGQVYKLTSLIGEGGYGSVYIGKEITNNTDKQQEVAVKSEKYSKSMIRFEVFVLRHAAERKCKHFCKFLGYGTVRQEFEFIIMSLLGKNLYCLRTEIPDRRFSLSTSLQIAIQTLEGIRELHKLGFISRDIKPGNFAPGLEENHEEKTIFMFDFGLAKRYITKNNNIVPSRGIIGWRGTSRYGSLTAHKRQDLSRRDDLESWFYMIVEMIRGSLPWNRITERDVVMMAKQNARNKNRTHFLLNCPQEFDLILKYIDKMTFDTEPDYNQLIQILEKIIIQNGITLNSCWDWKDRMNAPNCLICSSSPGESKEIISEKCIFEKQNFE